jgi:hypothetical protein
MNNVFVYRYCVNCKKNIDLDGDEYIKLNTEVIKLHKTSLRKIMDYRRNYIYLCKDCAIKLLMDREPKEE